MRSLWSIVALSLFLASCVSPSARSANRPPEPARPASSVATASPPPSAAALAAASAEDARGPVPISPEDARWGSPVAPVTMVVVTDLQCPFCGRANPTMLELQRRYGPDQLRIVVKHNPLPFHQQARPAALAAIAVQRARGDAAFFAFISHVFERQQELSEDNLLRWMAEPLPSDGPRQTTLSPSDQIDRDVAFAATHGMNGTPGFLVNGRPIHGAQPLEEFTRVIDEELAAVAAARREGKPVSYADRTLANYVAPEPPPRPSQKERDEDLAVWQVPVGKSPVLGPADALVTIIEFSDYQCPFCKRVQPTLDRIVEQYGKDVRIVFKHHPLPFHDRARPAANLAAAVYREKGNEAFWKVTRSLFGADPGVLTEESLLALGAEMKLSPRVAAAAVKNETMAAEIAADVDLSDDFQASGTPAFFVNGRRLVGAQPFESFAALIDEQLAVAQALVRTGTPRAAVYDRIMKDARGPADLPTVELGAISDDRASRGPRGAAVVVQEFSDFQCPFCSRVQPTLDQLRKEFPRDVRIVFRNLPLDFHDRSHAAANAALEARARGGDAAFWRMHDLLFSNQRNLSDENIAALAKSAGVDGEAVLAAAREGRYDKVIEEDVAVAGHAGIRGTPAFVVNGYYISGAQPYTAFRRAVLRALADKAKPAKAR